MKEDFMEEPVVAPHAPDVAGLSLLTALTASEIFRSATASQARGFYVAIGKRIADFAAIDDVSNFSALTLRINRIWHAMHWGEASLTIAEDGIIIHHRDMPDALEGDVEGHWPDVRNAILEGAYDGWFRALGSGPELRTWIVHTHEGQIELRHGR
jgi:hypothetical protein